MKVSDTNLPVQLKFLMRTGRRKVKISGNSLSIRTRASFRPLDFKGSADFDTYLFQFVDKRNLSSPIKIEQEWNTSMPSSNNGVRRNPNA